jgi:hypothetical protein
MSIVLLYIFECQKDMTTMKLFEDRKEIIDALENGKFQKIELIF